jgi:hypothetical protein
MNNFEQKEKLIRRISESLPSKSTIGTFINEADSLGCTALRIELQALNSFLYTFGNKLSDLRNLLIRQR